MQPSPLQRQFEHSRKGRGTLLHPGKRQWDSCSYRYRRLLHLERKPEWQQEAQEEEVVGFGNKIGVTARGTGGGSRWIWK
eukprot:351973-Chlamydomonas_euryale.AAC.4